MDDILNLLQTYHYFILFPLSIVGGAAVAIVCGFLIFQHQFSFLPVITIIVLGDMIGDSFLYIIGRWGMEFMRRHGYRVGVTPEKLEKASDLFGDHHHKAVYISKLAMAIGIVGLVAAGCIKVNFWHYIRICMTVTFIRSVLLIGLSYSFGYAYKEIEQTMNVYVAWFSAAVFVFVLWWLIHRFKRNALK